MGAGAPQASPLRVVLRKGHLGVWAARALSLCPRKLVMSRRNANEAAPRLVAFRALPSVANVPEWKGSGASCLG